MRDIVTFLILMVLLGCSKADNRSNIQPESSIKRESGIKAADSSSTEKFYTVATLDEYKAMYSVQSYITTQADESKTETIDFDCAIFIYPTDEQIEEMKKEMGEEDFPTIAGDNDWYQAMAINLMDSLHIKKVVANGTYLRLKGFDESWTLDIRKDNLPSWNLIIFKRTKEPEIVPTAGLTIEQVKAYFGSTE